MLTKLTIENLKCFAEKTEIPLAPITLIYGENSAGKSTILLAIQLLRRYLQDNRSGNHNALPFGDIVTRGDKSGRNIVLGSESRDDSREVESKPVKGSLGYSLNATIGWSDEQQKAVLNTLRIQPTTDERYRTDAYPAWDFARHDDEMVAPVNLHDNLDEYNRNALLKLMTERRSDILDGIGRQIERDIMREFLAQHPEECKRIVANQLAAMCPASGPVLPVNEMRFGVAPSPFLVVERPVSPQVKPATENNTGGSEKLGKMAISGENKEPLSSGVKSLVTGNTQTQEQALAEAKEWRAGLPAWISECPPSWRNYRESATYRARVDQLRASTYRDVIAFCAEPNEGYFAANPSFIRLRHGDITQHNFQESPILTRDLLGTEKPELSIDTDHARGTGPEVTLWCRHESESPAEINAAPRLRQRIESELTHSFCCDATNVAESMRRLVVIAPLRQRAERIYATAVPNSEFLDIDGATVPAMLRQNPSLCSRVNDWLTRLGVDYAIEVRPVNAEGYFQLLLRDTRNPEASSVHYADVGFGISQILPIFVACLSDRPSTILVEQPELHIHPRLQAELGSLFAEATYTYRHQLIVETHSEHLMLRIQRLIRNKEVRPDDTCVLYVTRGDGGSGVQQLELNEDGEFLEAWPNGFFPERLQELL